MKIEFTRQPSFLWPRNLRAGAVVFSSTHQVYSMYACYSFMASLSFSVTAKLSNHARKSSRLIRKSLLSR